MSFHAERKSVLEVREIQEKEENWNRNSESLKKKSKKVCEWNSISLWQKLLVTNLLVYTSLI